MRADPSIFKMYDIRGIYPEQMDEEMAYRLGRALVIYTKARTVVVGRDGRPSSAPLFQNLVRGLMEQGADVVDMGLCSTPMFYFTLGKYQYEAGVMVTASHNPKQYNGFKMYRKNIVPISGEQGMDEIQRLVLDGRFPASASAGNMAKKDYLADYVEMVASFADRLKKPRIVADAGNGMACYTTPKLFEKLGIDAIKLFYDLDCTFPNHEANPIKPETLKDLQAAVIEHKADLGVAFDGDADRVGFVDENARFIPADIITAMLAEYFLKKRPGSGIIFNVGCTKAIEDAVERNEGFAIRWKTGHSLIKAKMKQEPGIIFGGEVSGHFYFKDFFYADEAVLALVHVLNALAESGKTLSQLVKPYLSYHHTGELNFEVHDKDAAIARIRQAFQADKSLKKAFDLDGMTMEFDGWWFNVRASNTEPLLRLNLEAKDAAVMAKMRDRIIELIKQV
jgi:phosphomannomutase